MSSVLSLILKMIRNMIEKYASDKWEELTIKRKTSK
jgi:hypothetical protein